MLTRKAQIIALIRTLQPVASTRLAAKLGLSRKTIAVYLKQLLHQGKIAKTGSTRNAVYRLSLSHKPPPPQNLQLHKKLARLSEDRVFSEIDLKLGLRQKLSSAAHSIVQYAFTEMLNNAIDHSHSKQCLIKVTLHKGLIAFQIRDYGIGLFKNIQSKFKLTDAYEAVDHVLKGKQTTQPDKHSGEGLFFTSRIADEFSIRSHQLVLTFDNQDKDARLRQQRFLRGTEVSFKIKQQTHKRLEQLFKQYTNEAFEFKKGEMRIKIHAETGNVSRSQARRLCMGLEKYDRVVFDFRGVKEIGQGFADEIFRVFQNQQPQMTLSFENGTSAVEFMILRAIRGIGK